MNQHNTSKGLLGVGVLSALSASLCCVTPLLGLLAGSSGLASTFSWLEPARPFLIGITVLVLGFAWYQKLKPKASDECGCTLSEKPTFMQSKTFLLIVTIFAGLMLAFPYYAHIFFPKKEKQMSIVDKSNFNKAEFTISGMTCTACEEHVNLEVNKLEGIISVNTSYENAQTIVEFDNSKTNINEIEKAIAKTGYTITNKKVN